MGEDDLCTLGLDTTEAEFILKLPAAPDATQGTKFLHTFFLEDRGVDVVFHGTIIKKKKRKRCTFVVCYYEVETQTEERGWDEDSVRTSLIVDALYGDLVLI